MKGAWSPPVLHLLLAGALLGALGAPACVGTETGNPADAELTLRLTPREVAPTLLPRPGLDEGWLSLAAVVAVAGPCDGAAAGRSALAGPALVDLAGEAPADLTVPAAGVCELRLSLAPAGEALPASAPAELAGRSLWLLGSRADRTPLLIASEAPLEVTLRASTPVVLGGEAGPVVLAFDLEALAAGVDLAGAVPDADGVVRVSPQQHPELLVALEAQIGAAVAVYRDGDGDGLLDKAELAAGPLLAAPTQ